MAKNESVLSICADCGHEFLTKFLIPFIPKGKRKERLYCPHCLSKPPHSKAYAKSIEE